MNTHPNQLTLDDAATAPAPRPLTDDEFDALAARADAGEQLTDDEQHALLAAGVARF
jgi:hypothetical protein